MWKFFCHINIDFHMNYHVNFFFHINVYVKSYGETCDDV
jgi:hypothetical protein